MSKVGLASEAAALLKTKGQSKERAQSRERRKWARAQGNSASSSSKRAAAAAVLEEKDEDADDDDDSDANSSSSGFASDTTTDEDTHMDCDDDDEAAGSAAGGGAGGSRAHRGSNVAHAAANDKATRSHRGSHGNESICASPPPSLFPSNRATDFTTDESKLHIYAYEAKEFLHMLEQEGYGTDSDDGWRLLPLIGPTRDLVHELTDVQQAFTTRPPAKAAAAANTTTDASSSTNSPHIRSSLARTHSGTSQGQQKFWLALWADTVDPETNQPRQRLEVLLVRCSNAGPILIGSPYDFTAADMAALTPRTRLLAGKVKSLLPSTLQTPGGSVKYSAGSPLANIHAVIGQSALASVFATIWSIMSPAAMAQYEREMPQQQQTPTPTAGPTPSSTTSTVPPSSARIAAASHSSASYRSRKLKLSHIPVEQLPSSLDLLPGFQTRLATEQDDIKTIGKLFRDFRKALAPRGHFVNIEQSLIEARKALAENRLWIYSVYSTTCEGLSLLAGYLTVGAETAQSIAITELFVHSDYRKRNVAESLVRAATIYYMSKAPQPKRQLVCLIPDSFDAATRVFARVGFRLGEQARLETTLAGVRFLLCPLLLLTKLGHQLSLFPFLFFLFSFSARRRSASQARSNASAGIHLSQLGGKALGMSFTRCAMLLVLES